MEVCAEHLEYHYLPDEHWKALFKEILKYYKINDKLPSLGVLAQKFSDDEVVSDLLIEVKGADIIGRTDGLLEELESYIKRSKFEELFNKTKELYEQGEEDDAIKLMAEGSEKIQNFSIKGARFQAIYRDFKDRQAARVVQSNTDTFIVPSGIFQLDDDINGGFESGTATLIIARSGVGKSTALRWFGMSAARRGMRVLHFQNEGKEKQVTDAYDAMWVGETMKDIKYGNIPSAKLEKLETTATQFIAQGGEIYVRAFEQFGKASIADCRNILIEAEKIYGKIHLVLFDYLEKFSPGDGKKYSTNDDGKRAEKLAVAEKIVNIATEFNCVCATATQANDIKPTQYNDPNFVITRSNISNLRATIDPFAYCITLNQTDDEYEEGIMRIHEEKFREYKTAGTFFIAQARDKGRLINVAKTKKMFYAPDEEAA